MEGLLIPALVAAVVTLLIEYVAKPQLEVRKERILERHRERRHFFHLLLRVEHWQSWLAISRDREYPKGGPWDQFIGKAADEYADAVRTFDDAVSTVRPILPRSIELLALKVALCADLLGKKNEQRVSAHELNNADERLDEVLKPLLEYFETQPRRLLRRIRNYRQIGALLQDEGETSPASD